MLIQWYCILLAGCTAGNKGKHSQDNNNNENITKFSLEYKNIFVWCSKMFDDFPLLSIAWKITWELERSGQTILFAENNTLSSKVIPI